MIGSFILFLVLFVGGLWTMGFAQIIPEGQALVFTAGLLLVTFSVAYIMRSGGNGATRRSAKDGHGAA